ncbi:MAG: hypothetical protein K0Q65_2085 [Clostridia bacterium]|jgi:hypothetical protein|nr:hypothetical protein [Clostridia bacterium]
MQGKVEKTNHHLGGVKCIVNTCHYYSDGDHCNAANIEVQPRNASQSEETDCATFAPR